MSSGVQFLQRAKSLTQQAEDEIRARILRGDFELGAPLSENTLATQLGVSKTPIREALLQLKKEGLVSIQPQRGSFVFDMQGDEIARLGELRETLELGALRLAAARRPAELTARLSAIVAEMTAALDRGESQSYRLLDSDFHQAFLDHCGNSFFVGAYASVSFRVQALRTRLSSDPVLNRTSRDEHDGIRAAIAEGDIDRAADLLAAHGRGTVVEYTSRLRERRNGAATA